MIERINGLTNDHPTHQQLYCTCLLSAVGHVGPPVPCNIIELVDVEEKEYYAKNAWSGRGKMD